MVLCFGRTGSLEDVSLKLLSFYRLTACIALSVAPGVPAFPSMANSTEELYDWSSDEVAVDSAEAIARGCLDSVDPRERDNCVYIPTRVCVSQFDGGKGNQYDNNQCSGFSAMAWGRILDDIYGRLLQFKGAPKGIQKSQSMWRAWSDFDCEIRSNYEGTMAAMDNANCHLDHRANRVMELKYLLRE